MLGLERRPNPRFGRCCSADTVYYRPDVGNQIPIWNGTSFTILTFSELQIAFIVFRQSSNGIYDVCIFNQFRNADRRFWSGLVRFSGWCWSARDRSGHRSNPAAEWYLGQFSSLSMPITDASTYTIPALGMYLCRLGRYRCDGRTSQYLSDVGRRFFRWIRRRPAKVWNLERL